MLAAVAVAGERLGRAGLGEVSAQGGGSVVSVSAANYGTSVAPDSIVAAFGTGFSTSIVSASTVPLPTTLAGATVTVRDSGGILRPAQLFYVSPGQINYLMPAGTAPGTATVTVQPASGPAVQGTVDVALSAPALFSANSDGQGVPAAELLRVKSDGRQVSESPYEYNASTQKYVPRAIDLGPAGEVVYLVLYGTAIRRAADPNGDGNLNENVHVIIGGTEVIPDFVGVQPFYVGVDQINVVIPRTLIGSGLINVTVTSTGYSPSTAADILIAAPGGAAPPQVSSFVQDPVLAGQTINITGQGFSANAADNLVRIAGIEAKVLAAAFNQLTVQIPFGATSGAISVRTPQGETISSSTLNLRTSVSGIIETTESTPLSGVKVRVADSDPELFALTGPDGNFIIPDTPVGVILLEVDPTTVGVDPPFVKVSLKTRSQANRDNPMLKPVSLQQASGPSINVGSPGTTQGGAGGASATFETLMPEAGVETGGIRFDVPDNASALFPNGATSGKLVLTKVTNGKVPAIFPSGIFSADVAQITTFGVKLNPGGKLTFPNTDNYAPGSQVNLYRLDQTKGSNTIGNFVIAGTATVSSDGKRIETTDNAVTDTTYFFAALQRPTTTVTGRVVESDGVTPVGQATVTIRGQEAFTDGSGSFVIRKVPATASTQQAVIEASFLRPNGRVDRVQRNVILGAPGTITRITPDLRLPGQTTNRPPVILAPATLSVTEGVVANINVVVTDPDANQTVSVAVTGAPFATIGPVGNGNYTLRIAPTAGTAGTYALIVSATDSLNLKVDQKIDLTVNPNRPPALTVPGTQVTQPGKQLLFTVSAVDPDAGQRLTITASGLPAGATLTSTGATSAQFAWTPGPAQVGDRTITFTVTDNGLTPLADSRPVLVQVKCPTITISPATLPAGSAGIGYSQTITQTDGFGAVGFTLNGGTLPPGLSLSSGGVLSGTPTQPGTFNFIVKATDANGCSGMLSYSVAIACSPITFNPATLPTGAPGAPYSQVISASPTGGNYIYSITSGQLPAGLTLNTSTGAITGIPLSVGASTFTISATGFRSCTGSRTYTITINPAVIVVNSLDDSAVARDGKCTLREAIANANQLGEITGGDCASGGSNTTINFGVTGTINLQQSLPPIDSDVAINGPGAASLTIRREKGGDYPIFTILLDRTVSISGVTVREGNRSGISNNGSLTLDSCVVRNNTSLGVGAGGGGIDSTGALTVIGCLVTENVADDDGGGISSGAGSKLLIRNSTITGNSATSGGALAISGGPQFVADADIENTTISGNSGARASAIFTDASGTLSMTNVTVSGNLGPGSAIEVNNLQANLTNCTIAFNKSDAGPAGINNQTGTRLRNTIIANNSGPGGNCGGIRLSNNNANIQYPGSGCNDTIQVVDPMLGPLADNGGPTLTHALLPGSPAIDKGRAVSGLTIDQRGFARPVDDLSIPNGEGGDGSDIGAYEVGQNFKVNDLGDTADAKPGDGLCENAARKCTLRAAIQEINALRTGQIGFAVTGTIKLTGTLPDIDSYLTISGPGPLGIEVRRDAGGDYRVFNIPARRTVLISGIRIANGKAPAGEGGGGVRSAGTLTIDECELSGNTAASGAAVENSAGTLTITDSTLSNNTGGAINNINGPATLTNVTLSGNRGGIAVLNRAGDASSATLEMTNCTVTLNEAAGTDAVIQAVDSKATPTVVTRLRNTLVAGNTSANFGGSQKFTTLGNNLDSDGTSGFKDGTSGDLAGSKAAPIDARLGPLAYNGGPTATHALIAGGPAINAGSLNGAPAADQRGIARPVGGAVDIGAFEASIDIIPQSLQIGAALNDYVQSLSASGGTTPYTFSILSGQLVTGVTLDAAGLINGIPAQPATADFIVRAVDSRGFAGLKSYRLTINCPSVSLTPTTLASAQVGFPYSQTVVAAPNSNGYKYTLASGQLPAGLSLDADTGAITGVPTAAGTASFTITATVFGTCAGSRVYSISTTTQPGTIIVNSLNDTTVAADNQCTLREAINNANSAGQTTRTDCAAGTISTRIVLGVRGTINLASALPELNANMTIIGPGPGVIEVRRGSTTADYRIFAVNSDKSVVISGLKISNGKTPAEQDGGGILNLGTLSLSNCLITGNVAGRSGGGIKSSGQMSIDSCSISENSAVFDAGILHAFGLLTIANSTIANNTANSQSGALKSQDATVTLTNVTVSGNTSAGQPGTIINLATGTNKATLDLVNCTLVGGGIITGTNGSTANALTRLKNTIVWTTGAFNFSTIGTGTSLVSAGNNIDSDGSSGFKDGVNGDIVGSTARPVDPLLGPLSFNGGPTKTHLPICGSPAIDKGTSSGAPSTDQRGIARPFNNLVDIGAVEAAITLSLLTDPLPNATAGASYNRQLTASGGIGTYSFFSTGLPAGLTLSPAGALSGTPTAKGTFNFTVVATDLTGRQACRSYSLTVQ